MCHFEWVFQNFNDFENFNRPTYTYNSDIPSTFCDMSTVISMILMLSIKTKNFQRGEIWGKFFFYYSAHILYNRPENAMSKKYK